MEKKTRAAKTKGPLIRDLKKITLDDLSPDQAHVIRGGKVYSCGGPNDDCQMLTIVIEEVSKLHVYISKVRATRGML
jgi:hypothetical protein